MKIITTIRKEILQLTFVVLSFVLMVVASYIFVRGIAEHLILAHATQVLDTVETAIRSDLREAEVALLHAGLMIEKILTDDQSDDQSEVQSFLTLIYNTLGEGWVPGFSNIYVYIQNEIYSGRPRTIPEDFIPEERPWHIVAEAAKGGIGLTSHFIDTSTGSTIISLAKQLMNAQGEKLGIIALDIDLSHISEHIKYQHGIADGYGLVLDENFIVIIHPFDENINQPMETLGPGYANLVLDLRTNPDIVSTQRVINNRNVEVMLISRQIYNGWFLGVARPVSSYYSDANSMALILSAFGLIFMIVLCYILIRLSMSKTKSDEASMEKSSFLARMSHEIRSPMNSILGMSELLMRKADSSELKEYIDIIHQSGNNLLSIINDILDFSKIESRRLQIQNRDYYIASVINDMINLVRPRIAEKSLDFLVNVDSSVYAQVCGDDMRLRQILTNLLSNAVKYTHRGFISLEIKMEKKDEKLINLICSVHDSGMGIKSEDHERVFMEFTRMDTKKNISIEGTGLGLAITRALCQAMGGDVLFESEYGRGSTFQARIVQEFVNDKPIAQVVESENKKVLFYDWRPMYADCLEKAFSGLNVNYKNSLDIKDFIDSLEHGSYDYAFISSRYAMDCIHILGKREMPLQMVIMVEPGEVAVYREVTSVLMPVYSVTLANALNDVADGVMFPDSRPKIPFTAPGAKILIVDDISTNLRVAKELMTPYNMIIHTCLNGPEALELIKINFYDLVFMDHMMPGMDGIETTVHIRSQQDAYHQDLPIVALTANVLSDQREMFLLNGLNDFLAKPIDLQRLNEILEKWLPKEKIINTPPPQREISSGEEEKIIDIPGLDADIGLRNSGSTKAVYFNILEDFCKDAESRLEQINEALDKNDISLYVTLVHALKGAARSIGAMEIGEKASWLEKAGNAQDLKALTEKTSDLYDDVRAIINNIKAATSQYEAEDEPIQVDYTSLHLDELKTALAEMDIEAVNRLLLEYANLSLDTETKNKISEVEQCILMFEYEKAIEKINELFL